MTVSTHLWGRAGGLLLAGLLAGAGLFGCNRQEAAPDQAGQGAAAAIPPDPQPVPPEEKPEAKPVPVDPKLTRSFEEATRQQPVPDWAPPDRTLTGKSVGKLYEDVKARWANTRLATDDGKRLAYKAVLDTELGQIEITLRGDWAPNHVRNFVALANASYYDGLLFERIHKEESETQPGQKLELLEGGCPKGDGTTGSGSIGYWLKPEFNDKATHDVGVVGAIHEEEADTAATRFYISLSKAPLLDGNFTAFGQVTQGLDVVRKIYEQPAQADVAPGNFRPNKPVVIRKVTIQSTTVNAPAAEGTKTATPQ